jgi:hypothetical protein
VLSELLGVHGYESASPVWAGTISSNKAQALVHFRELDKRRFFFYAISTAAAREIVVSALQARSQ